MLHEDVLSIEGNENLSEEIVCEQQAKKLPPWAQEVLGSLAGVGVASLDGSVCVCEQEVPKEVVQELQKSQELSQEVSQELPLQELRIVQEQDEDIGDGWEYIHQPPENAEARTVLSQMDVYNEQVPELVKILIIGRTGSGKSTLVNTLFGLDVAPVEQGGVACQHEELVTKYHLVPISRGPGRRKVIIMIYDTVGLGEEGSKDKKLFHYIKKNVKKVHLLLVCHKLYDKVDHSTANMLQKLAEFCQKDIFNHMIFLLTHADAYRIYIKSNQKEVIKRDFKARCENMKGLLSAIIAKVPGVKVDGIPFCLTCDDTKFILPHTPNWEYDLWLFILHNCDKEAKIILSNFARIVRKIEIKLT